MLTKDVILEATHRAWWARKSVDPTYRILIFETGGIPMAVQTFFDIRKGDSAWWGFYMTDNVPKYPAAMFEIWRHVEVASVSYAFDHLRVNELLCETLRQNTVVSRWHKYFGFTTRDPSISANAEKHDLIVLGCDIGKYTRRVNSGAMLELHNIDIEVDPRDA